MFVGWQFRSHPDEQMLLCFAHFLPLSPASFQIVYNPEHMFSVIIGASFFPEPLLPTGY